MKTPLWDNSSLTSDNILAAYEAIVRSSSKVIQYLDLKWIELPRSVVKDGYLFLAAGSDRFLVVTPDQTIGYSRSLEIKDFEAKVVPSELANLANFFADLIQQVENLSNQSWAKLHDLADTGQLYCQVDWEEKPTEVAQTGWLECWTHKELVKFTHPIFAPGNLGIRQADLHLTPSHWGLKITRSIPPTRK